MLKVGIAGLGFISHENILGYLGANNARIASVCDPNRQRAEEWIAKWGFEGVRWHPSLEAMLNADSLDLVEVLTPHHLHCEHVIQCARAGIRGISVQKPMAVGLRECDQMIEACRNAGSILRVYENYIFYPVYQRAKELLRDGEIGRPVSIRIHTMAGVRQGAAWPHFWDPAGPFTKFEQSGNSPLIGDDGLHKFQLATWLIEKPISRIGAWIDGDTPLDAPAFLRLKFESEPGRDSQYGQLDFNFSPKLDIPSDLWLDDFVEIFGEHGVMWIHQCAAAGERNLFAGNEMSHSGLFPPIVVYRGGKVRTFLQDLKPESRNWSSSFVACTRHFLELLEKGGQPVCTGEEGKMLNRYAIAALLSAQEQRDVDIDEVTTEAEQEGRIRLETNFCRGESLVGG